MVLSPALQRGGCGRFKRFAWQQQAQKQQEYTAAVQTSFD
jgi:hypothetical protein